MASIGSLKRFELKANFINERGYKDIVEVGVWKGETTRHILTHCPSVENYYGIDLYFGNMVGINDSRLVKKKGLSVDIAKEFKDKSVDLVFIDADHCYEAVINDINAWLPKVRDGGWIGGHDYLNPHHRWCAEAVDDYFGKDMVNDYEDAFTWWVNVEDSIKLINKDVDSKKYKDGLSSIHTQGYKSCWGDEALV